VSTTRARTRSTNQTHATKKQAQQTKNVSPTETKTGSTNRTNTAKKTTDSAESEAQRLKGHLLDFQASLALTSENGLFTKRTVIVKFENLESQITRALNFLNHSPPDVINARQQYAIAYNNFNTAIKKADFSWRLQYVYAFPEFAYLVGVFVVLLGLSWYYSMPNVVLNLKYIPKGGFMWGAIGGILQGLYELWREVSDRKFRGGFIGWYLALPVIGAILGGLMYLTVEFGVVAATSNTIHNTEVPILLAALAGFSWKWSIGTLQNVEKMFKASSDST